MLAILLPSQVWGIILGKTYVAGFTSFTKRLNWKTYKYYHINIWLALHNLVDIKPIYTSFVFSSCALFGSLTLSRPFAILRHCLIMITSNIFIMLVPDNYAHRRPVLENIAALSKNVCFLHIKLFPLNCHFWNSLWSMRGHCDHYILELVHLILILLTTRPY